MCCHLAIGSPGCRFRPARALRAVRSTWTWSVVGERLTRGLNETPPGRVVSGRVAVAPTDGARKSIQLVFYLGLRGGTHNVARWAHDVVVPQPADEPYGSRDRELGQTLRSWTDAYVGLLNLTLQGPLDAPGMNPTWILRMSGLFLEANVCPFYGPHANPDSCRG